MIRIKDRIAANMPNYQLKRQVRVLGLAPRHIGDKKHKGHRVDQTLLPAQVDSFVGCSLHCALHPPASEKTTGVEVLHLFRCFTVTYKNKLGHTHTALLLTPPLSPACPANVLACNSVTHNLVKYNLFTHNSVPHNFVKHDWCHVYSLMYTMSIRPPLPPSSPLSCLLHLFGSSRKKLTCGVIRSYAWKRGINKLPRMVPSFVCNSAKWCSRTRLPGIGTWQPSTNKHSWRWKLDVRWEPVRVGLVRGWHSLWSICCAA